MQTPPEAYDAVVLGSGEAGKYLAWALAKQGLRAVVIERKYVGGSCPNIACLPSKNVTHSEGRLVLGYWGATEPNAGLGLSRLLKKGRYGRIRPGLER